MCNPVNGIPLTVLSEQTKFSQRFRFRYKIPWQGGRGILLFSLLERTLPIPEQLSLIYPSMKSSQLILSSLAFALVGLTALSCAQQPNTKAKDDGHSNMPYAVSKTEAEWKKELTPEQFYVLRSKGTEAAFTGNLWITTSQVCTIAQAAIRRCSPLLQSLNRAPAGRASGNRLLQRRLRLIQIIALGWSVTRSSAADAEGTWVTCSTMARNQRGFDIV